MTLQMGTLLSSEAYRRLLEGRRDAWRQIALERWQTLGITPLFAPPTHIDLQANSARMAVPTGDGWRETVVSPIPRVYYNRLLRPRDPDRRALRALNGDPRVLLFNETNRWRRGMVLEMLASNPQLGRCLPPSRPLTAGVLPELAEGVLYLAAPAWGSIRRGGYLLRRRGVHLRCVHIRSRRRGQVRLGRDGTVPAIPGLPAPPDLPNRPTPPEARPRYWISELGELPAGPGCPVEWRFYVVRAPAADGGRAGAVPGSGVPAAQAGDFVLAGEVAKYDLLRPRRRRERCWPLGRALRETFAGDAGRIAHRLRSCALAVAGTLAAYLPGIAHVAVDLWLDRQGTPRFADVTGAFRLDWLARAGSQAALRHLQEQPARFARRLLEEGVDRLDVDFGRAR